MIERSSDRVEISTQILRAMLYDLKKSLVVSCLHSSNDNVDREDYYSPKNTGVEY